MYKHTGNKFVTDKETCCPGPVELITKTETIPYFKLHAAG